MNIFIATALPVSAQLLIEILNVAICGACGSWANVTGRVRSASEAHLFESARFTAWSDPSLSADIGLESIAAAVGDLLSQPHITYGSITQRLLRAVVNDDSGAVDMGVADLVARHALQFVAPLEVVQQAT